MFGRLSVAAALSAVLLGTLGSPALASRGLSAGVEGVVVEADSQRPVAGARVWLPDLDAATTTRADGTFSFGSTFPTERPYRRIRAVVTAPGLGRWSISGVPLYPSDILRLRAELTKHPRAHAILTPEERRVRTSDEERLSVQDKAETASSLTCSGWPYQLVPPPNIRVRIIDESDSKLYGFVFYAKHVLPNEWIPSWDADALGAGAVAVRTYAHYRTLAGHAFSSGADCADIRDDGYDQIFDPTWSTASTDRAVEATFGSILYRSGGIFLAQYYAGSTDQACAPVTGLYEGRMSQWGTQNCAKQGKVWPGITTTFYTGAVWNYLKNLLLNPSATTDAMYPWITNGDTKFSRVKGGAYDSNWHWQVSPRRAGKIGRVWQERPFGGNSSTGYDTHSALRCGRENNKACTVTFKVTVISSSGREIPRSTSVTVPRDGDWHVYNYDPSPAGIAHSTVRYSAFSYQSFGLDAPFVTAPFGGP